MYDIKSKRTGRSQILTDEEFKQLEKNEVLLKRFNVTHLFLRTVNAPIEIKKTIEIKKPKDKK